MKTKSSTVLFSLLVFLSGCASLQTAGEVRYGRQALLKGNYEITLGYFYAAAQRDPGGQTKQGFLRWVKSKIPGEFLWRQLRLTFSQRRRYIPVDLHTLESKWAEKLI